MKEWWLNLSLREKQTFSIGLILITLLLFYWLIWLPISNQVTEKRERIQNSQNLLTWMEATNITISELEKNNTPITNSSGSILGIIQNEINNSNFAEKSSGLHQVENNTVQFNLKKISFDDFIAWLTQLWQTQGLMVTQLTITPDTKPGIVSADVVLQR